MGIVLNILETLFRISVAIEAIFLYYRQWKNGGTAIRIFFPIFLFLFVIGVFFLFSGKAALWTALEVALWPVLLFAGVIGFQVMAFFLQSWKETRKRIRKEEAVRRRVEEQLQVVRQFSKDNPQTVKILVQLLQEDEKGAQQALPVVASRLPNEELTNA